MKLISMTSFVLEQEPKINESHKEAEKAIESIFKYAKFLKTSLTLGMFIPCGEDDNVLEEPLKEDYEVESDGFSFSYDAETYEYDLNQYKEAKERILFDGFESIDTRCKDRYQVRLNKPKIALMDDTIQNDFAGFYFYDNRNEKSRVKIIEDLLHYQPLTLTPQALKQIGL